jgi:Domain of unknown function (DUF5916)/Carbohydrate family 9 binding domain-like
MMKPIGLLVVLLIVFLCSPVMGSTIEALKTTEPPNIDGILDDALWKKTKGYSGLMSINPEFGKPAKQKTVVYTAYDKHYLYFGLQCYDNEPGKVLATVHKRDISGGDDLVGVWIDSHNDGQNAYFLISNPFGIQMDGILNPDGTSDMSQDFIFESVGKKHKDGYSVEIKIPFQSLRFSNANVVPMKIGFFRLIKRYSEQYAYPEWILSKGSRVEQLAQVKLEGIKYKRVFQLLPSVTYMDHRELDVTGKLARVEDKRVHMGLTSKIGITSDLTLDVTINPDFSYIESDKGQVDVNLRVDILREEKRPFFLEGLEHFMFAGTGFDTPIHFIVNTRNIIDPFFGLKLSGKLGNSGIINSLFSVDEAPTRHAKVESGELEDPGNNYFGIIRYKHLLGKESYVGGVITAKEFKDGSLRTGGLDSRLRLNGLMVLNVFYLRTIKDGIHPTDDGIDEPENSRDWAVGGNFEFDSKNYYALLGYHDLSKHFKMSPGRVVRTNYRKFSSLLERFIYTSSKLLKRITLGYDGFFARDKEFSMNEYSHRISTRFDFPLYSRLTVGYTFATEVYNGIRFDRNHVSIYGRTQPFKFLFMEVDFISGASPYYPTSEQGDIKELYLNVTLQPTEKFSSSFSFTRETLHHSISKEEIYNITIYRNKTTYQLNKHLSLRSILEYKTSQTTRNLLCDALLEFTYIPGTVIHLGYGPMFEKERIMRDAEFRQWNHFRTIRSTVFFKASYLFRF